MGESKRFTLNEKDLKSLFRGLLITAGGAILVWALEVLPQIDFGEYTPFIVPVGALLINTILKTLNGKK